MFSNRLRVAAATGAMALSAITLAKAQNADPKFVPFVNVFVNCKLPDEMMPQQLSAALNAGIKYGAMHGLSVTTKLSVPSDIPPERVQSFLENGYLDIDVSTDPKKPMGPHIVCKPDEQNL